MMTPVTHVTHDVVHVTVSLLLFFKFGCETKHKEIYCEKQLGKKGYNTYFFPHLGVGNFPLVFHSYKRAIKMKTFKKQLNNMKGKNYREANRKVVAIMDIKCRL